MSTARAATIQRVEDILRLFDDHDPKRNVAIALLNTMYPEIREAKQLKGVPEGSILIVPVQAGVRPMVWEDNKLHGALRVDAMPVTAEWTIERYGPLTVVWMP